MNTEYFIALVAVLSAITSTISAIAAFKREEIKARLEKKALADQEADRIRAIRTSSGEETVELYRKLSEQYAEISQKDKKLLRTITYIIRSLIVLDKNVADLLHEMEAQWDEHSTEARTLACPFYEQMNAYMVARMHSIQDEIRDAMDKADRQLFNGQGPVITKDKSNDQ